MQFSKKNIAIVALVLILAASNIAFAVLYMTKNVSISGGVATAGAIEIYDSDGTTPLTSYDFPLFTGGTSQGFTRNFFVNNTGNTPVYVYWNISSSSITWAVHVNGYDHMENGVKYSFIIINPDTMYGWSPNDFPTPEALYLGVGEGQLRQIGLYYSGEPNTAETFTLVMSFYAQDA
jgi:hypothetical protein